MRVSLAIIGSALVASGAGLAHAAPPPLVPCDPGLAAAALAGSLGSLNKSASPVADPPQTIDAAMARFDRNGEKLMRFQPRSIAPYIDDRGSQRINQLASRIYGPWPRSTKETAVTQANDLLRDAAVVALGNGVETRLSDQELKPAIGNLLAGQVIRSPTLYQPLRLNEGRDPEALAGPIRVRPGGGCPQCQSPDPVGAGGDVVVNMKADPPVVLTTVPPFAVDKAADQRCQQARDGLINAVDKLKGAKSGRDTGLEGFVKYYRNEADPTMRGKPELQDPARKLADYADGCLTTQEPQGLKPEGRLSQSVGAVGIGEIRVCTATRISKSEVLTARHCFMTTDEEGTPASDMPASVIRSHWFEFEAGGPLRYQVCGLARPKGAGSYVATSDFVVATIATPASAPQAIPLLSAELKTGDYLYVPGLNLAIDPSLPFRPAATRVDGCRVSVATSRCIIHGCQTIPGTSGAPIFVMRQQQGEAHLELAGLHIAGREEQGPTPAYCALDKAVKTVNSPNVGLPVSLFQNLLTSN